MTNRPPLENVKKKKLVRLPNRPADDKEVKRPWELPPFWAPQDTNNEERHENDNWIIGKG